MLNHYLQSFKNISLALCILGVTLQTGGCKADASAQEETAASALTDELPALLERKGALASSEEWQKTKQRVAELINKINATPNDTKARLQLAVIYIAEARITGEHPYYYPAILKILDKVIAIDAQNFEALVLKSSVKMSQHQFAEAKQIAEKAKAINPSNAYVYGVLVDANVELGDYEQAVAMSDKMQQLKPSLESYSRASYLREIYGDYNGAKEAMALAVQAGLPGSEPQSWSKNTLAYLYEKTGDHKSARAAYEQILSARPSYAFALKGLASIDAEQGNYDKALNQLDQALEMMPEFSFQEKKADIYAMQGKKDVAMKAYGEVITMLNEDAASGHSVNLELSRVHAKMGNYGKAKEFAMKEYKVRPGNIDVNTALAWISLKNNDLASAEKYMSQAMRTGNKDPEMLWKASEIAKAKGDKAKAETLLASVRKTNAGFKPGLN